jgi:HlyD family secretion protein
MDEPRSFEELRSRRRRRFASIGLATFVLAGVAYGVLHLGRAAPVVSAAGLWIDTVREGDLTREVRGVGELVPDDDASRWAAADVEGRVERRLLEPGAVVRADTVLLQLSNPDVEQAAVAADLALDAAVAGYESLEASLRTELLTLRSAVAAIESERAQAAIQAEVDNALAAEGLLSLVTVKQSNVRAEALTTRARLEQERLRATEQALNIRLATQRAEVESRRTMAGLRRRDREAMTVRAGIAGVLQEVAVEVGQRVGRGANLARVIDPERLKARLRIPEAQTTGVAIGLKVTVDTRSGIVGGRVERVAPSAQNGTVAVDVALAQPLPAGSRPDMSVDGTIELEQLSGIRHISRPAAGPIDGETVLYRVSPDGTHAERVVVRLGRASANSVQILSGDVSTGDRLVLSDTSSWGDEQVVRLQ